MFNIMFHRILVAMVILSLQFKGEFKMLNYNYIKEQMREIFALTQPKGIFKTSRFDSFLYDKFFSNYIENSKEISTTFNAETMIANLKENVNSKRYQLLRIESDNTNYNNFTVYFKEPMSTSKHTIGGLVTVELEDNKATLTTFQHNSLTKLYNYEEVVDSFAQYIEGTTVEEVKEKEIRRYEEKIEAELQELNRDVGVKFPLKEEIYLPENYVHPYNQKKLNTIKKYSGDEYNRAKRTVVNNGKMLNKRNSYHRAIIGSNMYHEEDFPVVDLKPELEEFTDQYVWDDEKIYYKSSVREFITYDLPDHYITTSTNYRGVNFGNISRISGKKDVGWAAIQKGDFYITERQLLLFDRGPNTLMKFMNAALESDTYKRDVIMWTFDELISIEGNKEDGTLLLTTNAQKRGKHKIVKMNENMQNIGFDEDELRYIVNLTGSLIEKTQRYL